MSEKRFRIRFEQEDGRGEIVNEKGVELTAREVVDCFNEKYFNWKISKGYVIHHIDGNPSNNDI